MNQRRESMNWRYGSPGASNSARSSTRTRWYTRQVRDEENEHAQVIAEGKADARGQDQRACVGG